jgi:hypothetical protein
MANLWSGGCLSEEPTLNITAVSVAHVHRRTMLVSFVYFKLLIFVGETVEKLLCTQMRRHTIRAPVDDSDG